MVAKPINRPAAQATRNPDDDELELGLRDTLLRQLSPLLDRLKNRWVLAALFIVAYVPFILNFMTAYQDHTVLQERISGQEAVLALPEPRTDDIEAGLRSWTAALEAAQEAQILELEDSTLIEKFIGTAISTGITIESISTTDGVILAVGEEAYDATPVLLRVAGDVAGIESFIALLEGDAVEALEVQSSLIIPEDGTFSGTISAVVFNRPVDPSLLEGDDEGQTRSRRVSDEELDAAASGTGSSK